MYLKSYIFCLYFILYLHVWIRIWIRIQNMDPDPQHRKKFEIQRLRFVIDPESTVGEMKTLQPELRDKSTENEVMETKLLQYPCI